MGIFSSFFSKPDVSEDPALETAITSLNALLDTKDADYPMLRFLFNSNNIEVLFVEGGHGGAVIYTRRHQCGSIDKKTCDAMVGECVHADILPPSFGIKFSYNGSGGECDSYSIVGSIPLQYKNRQEDYLRIIADYCNKNGIEYKQSKSQLGFLNWA